MASASPSARQRSRSAAPICLGANIASGVWAVLGLIYLYLQFAPEIGNGASFGEVLARPTTFLVFAAILVPIAVLWFLALLAWRAEELRLRS